MQEISCRWELDDDDIINICKHKNDDKSQFCFANSLDPIGTYVPKSMGQWQTFWGPEIVIAVE